MDVLDLVYFSCSGEGKGESEAPGGVRGRSFIENPRRGSPRRGGGGGGGCLLGIWGGRAAKYFIQGRNSHQAIKMRLREDFPFEIEGQLSLDNGLPFL